MAQVQAKFKLTARPFTGRRRVLFLLAAALFTAFQRLTGARFETPVRRLLARFWKALFRPRLVRIK